MTGLLVPVEIELELFRQSEANNVKIYENGRLNGGYYIDDTALMFHSRALL